MIQKYEHEIFLRGDNTPFYYTSEYVNICNEDKEFFRQIGVDWTQIETINTERL